MDDRARVTIGDVVTTLVALAALRGLYPVYRDMLEAHDIGEGPEALLATLLPLAILVLLGVVYTKAGVGAGSGGNK